MDAPNVVAFPSSGHAPGFTGLKETGRKLCEEYRRGQTPMTDQSRRSSSLDDFRVLASSGDLRAVIVSGKTIPKEKIEAAAEIRRRNPMAFTNLSDAQLALMLLSLTSEAA